MEPIIFAIVMGFVGGPIVALAMRSSRSRKKHAERKARFESGRGSNPDKDALGPHRPFAVNALVIGAVFAAVGYFIGAQL
ncbi:hypothetical protein ACIFOC_02496 [Leucobacter aridicollis]|uniref:hypothetical protein n=1 Tax=Leucobacter aridicollis TaxID=283878 RepID=UPI002169D3CF|nr:hypothetical protein [Leucobacter aridicollis]MCS3428826.1 hypothetical protein [Leucobacter aridicollis]